MPSNTASRGLAAAAWALTLGLGEAQTVKSPTPPMGWNSYNRYNCFPNEAIIRQNAQGLVDLGFAGLGYDIVTVDCGWPSRDRDAQGRLQWNETLFPSGPVELGDFIHGLGLQFGLYSGAGYLQCGSSDIPASLGYEDIDAQSFAEWGGDSLNIGLGALSYEEERFHFGFWSLMKSPLFIGGVMDRAEIPAESLKIMSNEEAIAINQDPLAKAAELVIRYTEEEWDIWAGELSGGRKALGIANWKNETQTVNVDLSLIGVASAKTRDVWAHANGAIAGTQEVKLAPHELRLLVLSDIEETAAPKEADYYSIVNATLAGGARLVDCQPDECAPVQKKAGNIGGDASVTFRGVSAPSDGALRIGVDFINYDYHHTIGDWESNSRNLTVSVNQADGKRWAFPLAGGDWFETGRLLIELDGFVAGNENEVVFTAPTQGRFAPDLANSSIEMNDEGSVVAEGT
ncbi:Alpha-galactosidase D like protein [Verticillium longisporum]|nr:Alpha-galactosidase D like protein [Verticillium longisporum]